jgi:hypothetical protein
LISENANKGIKITSEIIPGPVIEQITTHSISGRSLPNSDVELFTDSKNQGRFFIDRIKADESGHFEWQGKYQKSGFNVTAITIDVYGNTSEFSSMDISGQGRPVKQHLPNDYVLGQNFPNPFNTYTQIGYGLPEKCHVKLEILNFIGKKIITLVNGFQDAGTYSVSWNGIDKDGRAVPSGIYLYRMEAVGRVDVKKMILVK